MYSDAELQKSNMAVTDKGLERSTSTVDHGTATMVSAEYVALSLIKQFSETQLPKASDLQWLVSEQDAPQAVSTRIINSLELFQIKSSVWIINLHISAASTTNILPSFT